MSIRFKCGACGSEQSAADSAAGQTATCPLCGERIRIPAPAGSQNDVLIEYGAPTPSWFLPIVVWVFVACIGGMSGFVYGHWCRASAKSDLEDKLVGTWKLDVGIESKMIVFSDDYTWLQRVGHLGKVGSTGTWRLDGKKLLIVVTSATMGDDEIGEESWTVITLDNAVLVVKQPDKKGQRQLVTFQRVE